MQQFSHRFLPFLVFIAFILLTACGSSRRSIAVPAGWELIGERKVNFIRDQDEVDVNSSNKFTTIRFLVEERPARINEVVITFENGDKLQPTIDLEMQPDQYSRDIQIASEGRIIDKISFRYRTTGNVLKGRANVLVYGQIYDPYKY